MDKNSRFTIVIVEDDSVLGDSLVALLDLKGYSVKLFEDAAQALASMRRGNFPALIVMDGDLPGMSGPEAIKTIREAGFSGTFIGMSAGDYRDEMIYAGAAFYWEKPFEVPEFMQAVEGLVATASHECPGKKI